MDIRRKMGYQVCVMHGLTLWLEEVETELSLALLAESAWRGDTDVDSLVDLSVCRRSLVIRNVTDTVEYL